MQGSGRASRQSVEVPAFAERRPNCPECGYAGVISNGPSWMCKACGKQWAKFRRRDDMPAKSGRPDCQMCGSSHTLSRGNRWSCYDCHHQWRKGRGDV